VERQFRWNQWNLEHVTKHGCTPAEVEAVILGTEKARKIGDSKFEVIGRGQGGRIIRVIFIHSPRDMIYPIHAMQLFR
jgi:uncharacterized DUF497 family protein